MTHIHPSSVIDPAATIGSNVTIGPFCIVEGDVVIGDDSTISMHVRLNNGSRIGKRCTLDHGVVIGCDPEVIGFDESIHTTAEIGDDSWLGIFASVERGSTKKRFTRIGHHARLHPYTHVAHDCELGHHATLTDYVQLAGHVDAGDYVTITSYMPVHQFSKIGSYSISDRSSHAVIVRKDVPPFVKMGPSHEGFDGVAVELLRANAFTESDIEAIVRAYQLIFQSGLNISDGVTRVKEEIPLTPHIKAIIDFIAASTRGIIRGRRS